jgi:hypothetical protein
MRSISNQDTVVIVMLPQILKKLALLDRNNHIRLNFSNLF